MAQSREAIVERDEEIKKLKTLSDEHERELEAAAMEYDEKCEKNNSLVSTVIKLTEENETLLSQLKTSSLVKPENQYFELGESNRVAELTVQLQGEADKVTVLQEKLSNMDTELSSLRGKCRNHLEQIESKTEKIESLEEKLGKFQNVNNKLLIRKSEYKKAESILKKDFELYKKKTKQNFKRLQNDILLMKRAGLSGNSESKLLGDIGTNTSNTTMPYDNKNLDDYEESLKKIKKFKVPKLKRKEAISDAAKTGEITKRGDSERGGYNSNTLFIANLNYEITSNQLTEFFSPFWLEKIELPRKGSGLQKNKGCAWVTFRSGEEAGAAFKKTNKQYFHGRHSCRSHYGGGARA